MLDVFRCCLTQCGCILNREITLIVLIKLRSFYRIKPLGRYKFIIDHYVIIASPSFIHYKIIRIDNITEYNRFVVNGSRNSVIFIFDNFR